nr:collinsiaXVI-like protein [Ipomoea batatas]
MKEEIPQRDTEGEKSQPYCVKLHQVFQSAKEEIEAIEEELLKIKAEGRKTGHDVLQRLEVLKIYNACVGKLWELPEDDKFCQLIVLEIHSTDLEDWKATGDHFPKLEHLSLYLCEELKEIPSGFAEVSRLKSIQLMGCRPSVVASAQEIKEEQLDYLNNIVDVVALGQYGYSSVSEPESDEYEFDENKFFRRAGPKVEKIRIETGKVISTFYTGKVPYVVRLNPDEDKQNVLLAGMSDKKIVQWDMNSGQIAQEYDQLLGAENIITFVDDI